MSASRSDQRLPDSVGRSPLEGVGRLTGAKGAGVEGRYSGEFRQGAPAFETRPLPWGVLSGKEAKHSDRARERPDRVTHSRCREAWRPKGRGVLESEGGRLADRRTKGGYLVDPASSHMLVSKIKPCMSKYELLHTVKLRMAH